MAELPGQYRRSKAVCELPDAGGAEKLRAKIAAGGRTLLVSAVTGLRGIKLKPSLELPCGLRDAPNGDVPVHVPLTSEAWEECMRDLTRMLRGGSVFIIGRKRMYGVGVPPGATGNLDQEACNAAFESLQSAIGEELVGQCRGLSVQGRPSPDLLASGKARPEFTPKGGYVDPAVLHELARQVAAHVSVSPGMQVVTSRGLPPTIYQPAFAVCIGCGQVRVLTFAFVGEPVTGDRPDRKRTPFSLRVSSENLVEAAATAISGMPHIGEATVRYRAEVVSDGIESSLDQIVDMEEELFSAIDDGDWHASLESGGARQASAAESRPAAPLMGSSAPGPVYAQARLAPAMAGAAATFSWGSARVAAPLSQLYVKGAQYADAVTPTRACMRPRMASDQEGSFAI